MSKRSKSSTRKRAADPARPFSAAVVANAKALAGKYQVLVRFDDEEACYVGRCVELPGAMGDGKTPDDCVASVREAIVAVLATMIEMGDNPPAPSVEGVRSEQVNVRLSREERIIIEAAAQSRGFKGMSDYIRAAALAGRVA